VRTGLALALNSPGRCFSPGPVPFSDSSSPVPKRGPRPPWDPPRGARGPAWVGFRLSYIWALQLAGGAALHAPPPAGPATLHSHAWRPLPAWPPAPHLSPAGAEWRLPSHFCVSLLLDPGEQGR
jgi:hypothetical protein